MKKMTKIIVTFLLFCSCFWMCACGGVGNSPFDEPSSSESGVEISGNESSSDGIDEDNSSGDSVNGGNWTAEVPFQ